VEVPRFQLGSAAIPVVLVGSSPFIGAGQFGAKAFEYQARFVFKPQHVAEVVRTCVREGFVGLHLLDYPWVVEGVREVQREYGELVVTATLAAERLTPSSGLLRLEPVVLMAHAMWVDGASPEELQRIRERLEEYCDVVGFATHQPKRLLDLAAVLPPVVFLPYNAEYPVSRQIADRLVALRKQRRVAFFAMKPLAAGRLKPEEAFRFVYKNPAIATAAVGIAELPRDLESLRVAVRIYKECRGTGRGLLA